MGSPVTVSIGVAAKPADIDAARFGSVNDLVSLADQQLYAAKAAGRARVLGKALGSGVPADGTALCLGAAPDEDAAPPTES